MVKKQIRTLNVDLDNHGIELAEKPVEEASLEEKLGGFGKAIQDIGKNLARNPDLRLAHDPRNLLCINTGFLTGTNVMTAKRTYVSALSPLKTSLKRTNGIYYSTASGMFGPALKGAGFDAVNISGRNGRNPLYLFIDRNHASFEDASDLIGKTTEEKIYQLAEKYPNSGIMAIGPAGESLVNYAGIAFSTYNQIKKGSKHMRFAGRGGMGAVMGGKGLVAVVVSGDESKIDVGDVKELNKEIATGQKTLKYRKEGTFQGNIVSMQELNAVIVDNFSRGSDPRIEKLYRKSLEEAGYEIKNKACHGCGVACWKEISKDGQVLGKLDFEPGMLLGPNLGIYDINQIMHLISRADSLGLDSISLGVSLGYELEKQKRFGDFELASSLTEEIGIGHHPLMWGVAKYSNRADNAFQVKGVELAAYPPHVNPGYSFAVGGPHTSIDTYKCFIYPDAANDAPEWRDNTLRGTKILLYDMNGLCKFSKVNFKDNADLYERVYGERVSEDDFKKIGQKVHLIARGIDSSLGFGHEDDVLPGNAHLDYQINGVKHFNTREFFEDYKGEVYRAYGEA
ncbi:MAG: aldehyde ferredoxin oxidoreductase N-terminal domain-containing protein [archaeon]